MSVFRAVVLLAVVGGLPEIDDSLHAEEQLHSAHPAQTKLDEGELRRRAMFGAQLAAITKEVQDRQKLEGPDGIVIEKVFPDTSAAEADVQVGDVILAIDGVAVPSVAMLIEKLAEARAGDVIMLDVVRDGAKLEKRVTLKEKPREKSDEYSAIYSHVTSHGARLRTIITRPKAAGRHAAVLLLQGYGNFSIDNPVGPPTSFTRIARDLAQHGYVTMRVDRHGCGDSEGGPCRNINFETELDGYRQALNALMSSDFVERENIIIFGHSLGGFTGPILASETPVRGIASFGSISGSWLEGILAQRRRWASLDGTSPAEVENRLHLEMQFWYPLLVEKQTPGEILKRLPKFREALGDLVIDDTYVIGRHYTWLQQVTERNMGDIWTKVASTALEIEGQDPVYPRVLSIWGTADWVAEKQPIAWIAEIVNRAQPGHGTFIALDSTDHYFFRADSIEESFQYFKPAPNGPFGEFNPAILETLHKWMDETAGHHRNVDAIGVQP